MRASTTRPDATAAATTTTPSATAGASSLFHLARDRRDGVCIEQRARSGKQALFFFLDVRAISACQRLCHAIELGDRSGVFRRTIEHTYDAIERVVQRLVLTMLSREHGDRLLHRFVVREAREERLLFVVLVPLHRASEEGEHVANAVELVCVGAPGVLRVVGRPGEVVQALLEAAMRSLELLERITRCVGVSHVADIFAKIGAASVIAFLYEGRSNRRFA